MTSCGIKPANYWVDESSFKNADEWQLKLLQISDGLPLSSAVPAIEAGVIGLSARQYQFYYQDLDLENVIRFLLGHTPFKDNLVQYAPVRIFNESERWGYTEMHTADWWYRGSRPRGRQRLCRCS
jgi:Plavaka transposase